MSKKCSKALKKRVVGSTDKIFEQSVREVLGLKNESVDDLHSAMDFIRMAQTMSQLGPLTTSSFDADEIKQMEEAKNKVSEVYQEKIKTLPTKMLNDIIKAHNLPDGVRRAPRTIENILSELTRRALLDDSDESDFISNNGDVDEPTRKSKRNSEKTPRKRSKATKNR